MKIETTATFIGHNECMGVSTDEIKSNIMKLKKNTRKLLTTL